MKFMRIRLFELMQRFVDKNRNNCEFVFNLTLSICVDFVCVLIFKRTRRINNPEIKGNIEIGFTVLCMKQFNHLLSMAAY